MYEAPHTAPDR